jgi:hypothetical protein
MVMRYADPFDTLFAFQQALENRQLFATRPLLGGKRTSPTGSI